MRQWSVRTAAFGLRNVDLMTAMVSANDRFSALHSAHADYLLRLLMKMTRGDKQTAEDLLQETMVRAWRHVDALPTEGLSQRRWLSTVARRIFIDTVRSRSIRPTETPVVDLEWITRSEDTTDVAIACGSVVDAFHRLSETQQRVLAELHFRGRPVEEIARDLGLPVGTVKSRAHYAMRALRNGHEDVD
jgi:RNA polymerase sigma factor (sigma-70 family)